MCKTKPYLAHEHFVNDDDDDDGSVYATVIPTKRERKSQKDSGIQMIQVSERMRRKCCIHLRSAYGSTVTALNKNVDFIYGSE